MSTNGLRLDGVGAAYLRVSTDKQETERQTESIRNFEGRHDAKIRRDFWFTDAGWERDADRERPEFNRLLRMARGGKVQWIVVDSLDRFGTKSAKRLMGYLADLEEAGCLLYTVDGKEWTGEDDATELTAWLGGRTSMKEQREKSKRVLGGMVAKAKDGAWMGGPPKLGFDVGCFDKATGAELWRVVFEGRDETGEKKDKRGKDRPVYFIRRRKVYPDGRTERHDGNVIFRTNKDTQIMRIVPTSDKAKLEAARGVFERYATESVSFFDLAKWLNGLKIVNSFGGKFQSNDIRKMLSDEAYLGYTTFSKRRNGRFYRHDAESGIVVLEPELKGKDTASEADDVIRSSVRLFAPIIDRPTWDAVRRKLAGRTKKSYAPKNASMYFAGIVVCSGCGMKMSARSDRKEYLCSTWDKRRTRGDLSNSPCERNAVRQPVLEKYIGRYLEETGKRIEIMKQPNPGSLTSGLDGARDAAGRAFLDGYARLLDYLAKHHPEEFNRLMWMQIHDEEDKASGRKEWGDGSGSDYVTAAVEAYRECADESAVRAELARLDAEHTKLTDQWADLPTPLAKEKAKARLTALEERIAEVRRQSENLGEIVDKQWQILADLERAINEAKRAMTSEDGASALRHRAEALRGLLCRIDCEFVPTGKGLTTKGGPGQTRSKIAAITFHPVAGEGIIYQVDGMDVNGPQPLYAKP